jgi:hypothetical protein
MVAALTGNTPIRSAGGELSSDIQSVNHVGMAVRDISKAAVRFEAMGFMLTPYSPHSGAWNPGDPVAKLAYGNRCIMFGNNYLEILASENAAAQSPRIAGFLARHQGGHIICFGTENPDAVDARLRASGIRTSGVIPLQRDIDTPEGMRTAKFERVQFAPDTSPEGYIQAARHLTPEYIYQPRYRVHPNQAMALSEVFLVTDDAEGFETKYSLYCGNRAERGANRWTFSFPLVSRLSVVAARDVVKVLPGSLLPPLPCIAGVAIETSDLPGVRSRLLDAGIPFSEIEGKLVVPAEEAMGMAIVFERLQTR